MKNGEIIFKFCDFGSSRNFISKTKSLTHGKGTMYYTSPQQAKSGDYTDKTDVYALGAIFFELLNGADNAPMEIEAID